MSGIYKLLDEVSQMGTRDPQWWEKMVHDVPDAKVVNRVSHLMEHARDKVILDIGGTGPMGEALRGVAKEYHRLDKEPGPPDLVNYYQIDLDNFHDSWAGVPDDIELIVAGEVIEHLSNAGHFLDCIADFECPIILTTPNAGHKMYQGKKEIVNKDHVAWYSYKTLTTLVTRHKFRVTEWFWYNGKPMTAEGLVFHMEPMFDGRT